ncbi:MAG: hypothetical protein E6K06_02445 [Methanobacteriota archaeon]|nr:MAG: hypothetical protein E6K06_02445 [Euryarchaeota archaeon]
MKIARPSKPEAPFKRKRSPPPQATKLLRYSFLSGVVFMVLLAIVFLPRMFPNQVPVEIVNPGNNGKLRLDTTNGTRLYIDTTTVSLELAKFNANFTRDGIVIGNLSAGLVGGNATLRFVDANADNLLDAGDYFVVTVSSTGCYHFEVFQIDVGRLAGYLEWGTGCPVT